MVAFRRLILALAVVTMLAGMASAQIITNPLVCNSVVNVPATLRSEGVTELVGDIVITCTGGTAVPVGNQIPTTNITVTLPSTVTSRLIGTATSALGTPSEALLLIDEPGAGGGIVPGFGPNAPQLVCGSPTSGCPAFASSQVGTDGKPYAEAVTSGGTVAPTVYQGLVNGNTVTFDGIPVLPPASAGVSRLFRITNIRIDASTAPLSIVQANIAVSAPASLPLSTAVVTVGSVNKSLATSVTTDKAGSAGAVVSATNINGFTQCNSITAGNVAFLNFAEQFASAFKTRFGIGPLGTYTGQGSSAFLGTSGAIGGGGITQSIPGFLYNSESGLVIDIPKTGGIQGTAGLADSGTRLQAQFTNLPSGATIYVSNYNVNNFNTTAAPFSARLVAGATAAEGADYPSTKNAITVGDVQAVPLSVTNGAATAVWEVQSTNPAAPETLSFAVYISFTPDLANKLPTAGNAATVALAYAPLISQSTSWIPRFNMTPTASSLLNIAKCNTVLLFPYITAAAGFDTGIAISNTSQDPLTPATTTSTGSCSLNFYGANAPTGTVAPLGPIPAGNGSDPTKFAFMLSTVAPNFTGYLFAVCDFQFAHGFAFISDVGTRNLAMGYLALVVNNGQTVSRPATLKGESLAQ